jgi:hypothetical protein
MAIQKGIVGGREREKIRQVTKTADVTGLFCLNVKMASERIPKTRVILTRTIDLHPKR